MNTFKPDFNDPLFLNLLEIALREDIGHGDHSSLASIPAGTTGKARLILKEPGILAGIEPAVKIFGLVDNTLHLDIFLKDGDVVKPGDIGLIVSGSVHSILKAERLVLNLMQRLSGVATATAQIVRLVAGTGTRILDTRKTTPGFRMLEKWAVRLGGGHNHRMGLYDMVMIKDNHIDYAGGITQAVSRTKQYLKENKLNLKIEVETRNLEEVKEALAGGVDRIMLDNFSASNLREAVDLINKKTETEASGGITLQTVADVAKTGVDFISVGAITHSVKSLDISLKEF